MRNMIKILIVEDETIVALDTQSTLIKWVMKLQIL